MDHIATHTTLETFNQDYEKLYERCVELSSKYKEAHDLTIVLLEENIKLQKMLNNLQPKYDLLLMDFKEQSAKIQQLNLALSEKSERINSIEIQYKTQISILNEQVKDLLESKSKSEELLEPSKSSLSKKQRNSLVRISKKITKKSIAQKICSNVRRLYEARLLETLRKTREDITPLVLGNISRIENSQDVKLIKQTSSEAVKVFSESNCNVEIIEHNIDKKMIKLINRTDQKINLGNHKLVSYSNGSEVLSYKFHKAICLKPGMEICLWSKYSEFKNHYPPNNFIMTTPLSNIENKENSKTDEESLWKSPTFNKNLIEHVIFDPNQNVKFK